MNNWEYRVIKSRKLTPISLKPLFKGEMYQYSYSVREVYYKAGAPKVAPHEAWVAGIDSSPTAPVGDDIDELKEDVKLQLKALDLPMLLEWRIGGKQQ